MRRCNPAQGRCVKDLQAVLQRLAAIVREHGLRQMEAGARASSSPEAGRGVGLPGISCAGDWPAGAVAIEQFDLPQPDAVRVAAYPRREGPAEILEGRRCDVVCDESPVVACLRILTVDCHEAGAVGRRLHGPRDGALALRRGESIAADNVSAGQRVLNLLVRIVAATPVPQRAEVAIERHGRQSGRIILRWSRRSSRSRHRRAIGLLQLGSLIIHDCD